LAEEDAEKHQGQAVDLACGKRLARDEGAEQDTGHRVEQTDQSHCAGAQVP